MGLNAVVGSIWNPLQVVKFIEGTSSTLHDCFITLTSKSGHYTLVLYLTCNPLEIHWQPVSSLARNQCETRNLLLGFYFRSWRNISDLSQGEFERRRDRNSSRRTLLSSEIWGYRSYVTRGRALLANPYNYTSALVAYQPNSRPC